MSTQESDGFGQVTVPQNEAFRVAYDQEMISEQPANSAERIAHQVSA